MVSVLNERKELGVCTKWFCGVSPCPLCPDRCPSSPVCSSQQPRGHPQCFPCPHPRFSPSRSSGALSLSPTGLAKTLSKCKWASYIIIFIVTVNNNLIAIKMNAKGGWPFSSLYGALRASLLRLSFGRAALKSWSKTVHLLGMCD